ncbi:MAG: lamin tail domain-containing protein, partial [Ignavibacteria bacterium]|nr:lamin tail domain-containing protein [Ignavibacteria bacterium]
VEFLNTSNEAINLKNWAISDLFPAPSKVTITTNDDFIQPGEYAIATPDTQAYAFIPPKKFYQTKFGSLGNTSDGVVIYDFRGAIIDSFYYKSSWGGSNGSSLERISVTKATSDSTNWTSSISTVGASPGIKNASANPKSYKTGSLVFNEILYEPETGGAEFVELYNTSNDSIQVGGMDLLIGAKERVKLSQATFIVPPKEFFVLASDSAIYKSYPTLLKSISRVSSSLSFSNEGTSLLVKDLFGTTLDSVIYSPSWHNRNFLETKNKSLERLNPALNTNDKANWSTSVTSEGATPGKQNSIYTQNLAGDSKVNISPNPFSPDNDGFEDFAIINFNLPYKLSQVQIKVFDSQGRLVRTLLENRPSATNNTVIFNGLDDEGRALRIGIYILLIEIAAEGNNNIETIKKPIVVARKL